MGEIVCFSARFFIHPNYTKEFENAYKKGCLITKISSKIKMPPFRSFLLKRVSPSYKGKEYLQIHKIFNRNTDLALKIFSENLKNSFLKTTSSFFYYEKNSACEMLA